MGVGARQAMRVTRRLGRDGRKVGGPRVKAGRRAFGTPDHWHFEDLMAHAFALLRAGTTAARGSKARRAPSCGT